MRSSVVHVKQTPHGDVLTTENGAPLFGLRSDRFSGLIMPGDTVHRPKPDPQVEGEVLDASQPHSAIKSAVEFVIPLKAETPYEVTLQCQVRPPAPDPERTEWDFVYFRFPQAYREGDFSDPELGYLPDALAGNPDWPLPFGANGWGSYGSGFYTFNSGQCISHTEMNLRATLDTFHNDGQTGIVTAAEAPVEIIRSAMVVREIIL